MWKLFATVLAITDTGGVSVDTAITDFRLEQDCIAAVEELFKNPGNQVIGGHRVTIKVTATCRPAR